MYKMSKDQLLCQTEVLEHIVRRASKEKASSIIVESDNPKEDFADSSLDAAAKVVLDKMVLFIYQIEGNTLYIYFDYSYSQFKDEIKNRKERSSYSKRISPYLITYYV